MSKRADIKTGTIVKLKSGGPDMTVKDWHIHQEAYLCQWFAGKKLESGYFMPETLDIVAGNSGEVA